MSEDNWFYEENGAQQGPIPAKALQAKIESGEVSQDNLVWKEGLPEWVAASQTDLCPDDAPSPDQAPADPPPHIAPATPPPQPNVFTPRKCQLNTDYTFGLGNILGKSWSLITAEFWPMVGFFALVFIIYNVAANLFIPIFFMGYPIMGGYMYYTLKRLRGETADIETVFDGFRRRFGSLAMLSLILMLPLFFLITFIILGFAVALPLTIETDGGAPIVFGVGAIATILMTVVVSIVSIVTSLATLLCLDCDIGWQHSLGQSWRAFKKYPVKLTVTSLIFGIVYQLGLLALFVGIFVTGAWIMIGYSCLYQRMFQESRD